MDPNTVVLDISSDEDVDWNDHSERGISDGGDDHRWLTELLDEVSKETYGEDSDEVVVVSEPEKTLKKSKLKSCVVDLDDDCVVLDNDPNEDVEIVNGDQSKGDEEDDDDDSDDIVVVSEKGQVACRDYPHSRHLCIKFPFSTTPNQNHCQQCYCYVCDSLAPCVFWGNGSANTDHCHATDKDQIWILARKNAKKVTKSISIQPVNLVPVADPNRLPLLPVVDPVIPPLGPIQNQNQNHFLASRNKLHRNLVSNFVLRHHQNHNLATQAHRPVFKRTGSVTVATTANRNPNGSYRGNFGNHIRQQNRNYNANEMSSGPNRQLGSLQPNVVNAFVTYPPQSQSQSQSQHYNSSTVNQPPLPPLPQFVNHPNPSFQHQVNSSPFPENPYYQLNVVPPPYIGPNRVDSPLVPVPDYTQNIPQGTQAQSPVTVTDPGFQDNGPRWPAGQDSASATIEGSVPTNGPSVGPVPDNLAEFRYDWIFDDQPVEPGFMDINDPYGLGLTDFSCDSSFIETGPIFEF